MVCLSIFYIALLCCLLTDKLSIAQQTFCGYNTERNTISIILTCQNPGAFINNIQFCSYGTPTVLGACNFAINSTCHFPGSLQLATKACLNQSECVITADNSILDPCPGVVKSLAVVASCSEGEGKSEVITLACSLTSSTPACPLPQWAPTYQINRSTICQPGNTQGFLNASEAARWGLVSLDWSIASGIWYTGSEMNATGAATLVEQARQIKQVNPLTKVFVYRNTELALSWLEPQRSVMFDPSFASFFLQYQPNNPGNFTPGVIYNEPAGAPCASCAQYFTNFSSDDAFQYFLSVSEQGEYGTSSPYVDGTFLDDSQAIPQEHTSAPANIGLTPIQLLRLQNATYRFVDEVIATLAAKGKYVWQGFDNEEVFFISFARIFFENIFYFQLYVVLSRFFRFLEVPICA